MRSRPRWKMLAATSATYSPVRAAARLWNAHPRVDRRALVHWVWSASWSARVIEKNGGVLASEGYSSLVETRISRY
jgi:hypothetical protein